jgi:hypothetical protein
MSESSENTTTIFTSLPGAANLNGLSDVYINTPADGELLIYDESSNKFVNTSPNSSGFQPADAKLDAVIQMGTATGMVARVNSSGTLVGNRQITAGSANIIVTNGDGVAGHPTIDLAANVLTDNSTHTLNVGYPSQPYAIGTASSGTITPQIGNGYVQTLINNGTFSMAPSSDSGVIVVELINGASAGGITFSGFNRVVGENELTIIEGDIFHITLSKVNSTASALILAMNGGV